jgi:SAM-dependent methyltransferase
MDVDDWNRRYASQELVWSAEPNRFVAEEVEGLPPGRALDLACGEGRNALWLAAQGWDVTAVDFASAALEKGRRLAEHHGIEVEWVEADATAWEPAPASFELVVIAYLQLPADHLTAALRHAVDGLAPGGTLVVVGHDRANLTEGHGGPSDPAVLYDADEIVAQLDGLVVERAGRVRRPVSTPDGVVEAIDTLVRARRPAGADG